MLKTAFLKFILKYISTTVLFFCDHSYSGAFMNIRKLACFFLRFYLLERERERARTEGRAEGEAGSPLSREPDVGLDPRTLRS